MGWLSAVVSYTINLLNYIPEIGVHFTFDPVCTKSKCHISLLLVVGVVLIQRIVQTLVEFLKV